MIAMWRPVNGFTIRLVWVIRRFLLLW
jgi:hypothetical protein